MECHAHKQQGLVIAVSIFDLHLSISSVWVYLSSDFDACTWEGLGESVSAKLQRNVWSELCLTAGEAVWEVGVVLTICGSR